MPIEVRCPECQALLRIADENAGRKSRCPNCSHVFTASSSEPTESQPVDSPFVTPLDESTPQSAGATGDATTNPYAPTYSEPDQQIEQGEFRPRRITLDEVLSKSWLIFKKHWVMACVAVLIVGAINFACNMVQNLVVNGLATFVQEPAVTFGAQALMTIVFYVLQIWLTLGQTMVMLDIARGRPVNLSKLFAAGPYLLNGIVATVIFSLILAAIAAVLIGIPAGIGFAVNQKPEGAIFGVVGGVILAAVPLIVASLAMSQYQALIVDRKLGGIDSLRVSYEITQGNKFTLFLIGIVLSVIAFIAAIVGLLMLCVGIIPAMIGVGGFSALVLVVTYLSMTGQTIVLPGSPNDPTSSQYVGTIP